MTEKKQTNTYLGLKILMQRFDLPRDESLNWTAELVTPESELRECT